ncbi:hypothetical protein [Nocardia sp. NPDC019302]|uniref:hypothetical protein n=1 Tax=Nocardia sp. NPDC019302 TaxID=3154592 RepID=UPI0033E0A3EF
MHIDDVGGYAGRARCFRVDPPYEGHEFVTICAQPAFGAHQLPEMVTYPATDTGAAAERSLKRRPGSFVIHEPADTDEKFDWQCWLALQMLGQPGYDLQASEESVD